MLGRGGEEEKRRKKWRRRDERGEKPGVRVKGGWRGKTRMEVEMRGDRKECK